MVKSIVPNPDSQKIVVIVGPTASGKSMVALELAKKIDGEIVNADSRQIYKYLNAGTSKPTFSERKIVPHHLYDFLEPTEYYSAGDYACEAARVIADILSRKRTAILAGGTGFYIRALFDGIPSLPKRDDAIRKDLAELAKKKGLQYLHKKLKEVDPVSAERIPYQNSQRVIRALEVYGLTKKPLSSWQPLCISPLPKGESGKFFIGLRWEKENLKGRIIERTKAILPGIITETKWLLQNGFTALEPGLQSLGYREAVQYLQGEISNDALVQLILHRTHQYAKRQLTWFSADKKIHWVDLKNPFQPEKTANHILKVIQSTPVLL